MIAGQRGTEEIGGPLRIAQLSGQVADLGLASLISFMAVLSVNLGLINLFPIPVLDGGHLLFFLAEALRGRPMPQRAQEYGFRAGLALIGALFIFATWNDLPHLGICSVGSPVWQGKPLSIVALPCFRMTGARGRRRGPEMTIQPAGIRLPRPAARGHLASQVRGGYSRRPRSRTACCAAFSRGRFSGRLAS